MVRQTKHTKIIEIPTFSLSYFGIYSSYSDVYKDIEKNKIKKFSKCGFCKKIQYQKIQTTCRGTMFVLWADLQHKFFTIFSWISAHYCWKYLLSVRCAPISRTTLWTFLASNTKKYRNKLITSLFSLLLTPKYASTRINLDCLSILAVLCQYKTILQNLLPKKVYFSSNLQKYSRLNFCKFFKSFGFFLY